MPFTAAELATIGNAAIDHYLRGKPIDNIKIETPLLDALRKKQKPVSGGINIVENIRSNYGSAFQWIKGSGVVTYNHRNTLSQATFPWSGWHDGLSLAEDELAANGIEVTDEGKGGKYHKAEVSRLVNLLEEQLEALFEGAKQEFARQLYLDGTQSADAITGLDALVAPNPAVGVVGGIDRAANVWWRNQSSGAAVAPASLLQTMEGIWRACTRNGGRPDLILAGGAFIDAYASATQGSNRVIIQNGAQAKLEGGYSELSFKGTPIIYDPVLDDLDTTHPPAAGQPAWSNRCYFVNTRHLRLRPLHGYDFRRRTPPRVYNQYVYYWAIQWKGGLTMNRANCHAVLWV